MNHNDLLQINVNNHTEKKNGLTYLSWAWAWDQILRADPAANYEVMQFPSPGNPNLMLPYQSLGNSAIVWVAVTVFGKTMTVQLPVLDFRNKCIADPNAFDVNTSIMRCLTKGIAMHGLGLYIYAGEDLPMEAKQGGEQKLDAENFGVYEEVARQMMMSGLQSLDQLKEVWKKNQTVLDQMKVKRNDLYQEIVKTFSEAKKRFNEQE
jgi:Protein of unknown function (DUF1071)